MDRRIEILAPAGSYEAMRAAMNAGCDAVYMGGSRFGARAYADNPDEDTLIRAIEEAHLRDKRLYLTVNTLVKEEERLDLLYKYLEKYYLAGLDAVIVQDVGVMRFIHRHFPKLAIHASTQTTITMGQGANLLKSMGVTRIVTARELSFKEIKAIRSTTDMEIETFVHGALCYSYSGQCLMSSMIGGRSGNRGRCAQPCRMPYQFFSDNKIISSEAEPYLLSPKDINTLALIPNFLEAGVTSFKIEGRMKRPEYAAGVTHIYRKYLDLYLSHGKDRFYDYLKGNDYRSDMLNLMDLYNRGGFSEGYGKTYHGKDMMSMARPNHSGVAIGRVVSCGKGNASIQLDEDVYSQDVLEIRSNDNKLQYEFTLKDNRPKGDLLKTRVGLASSKKNHRLSKDQAYGLDIKIGDMVYRTRNNSLLDSIAESFINKDARQNIRGFLYAKQGERLQLTLSYKDQSVTAYHNKVEEAIKQPMDEERLRSSIDKLGDTMYQFKELYIESDKNIFIPVAGLNEIRREAVAMLTEAIVASFQRSHEDLGISRDIKDYIVNKDSSQNIKISVSVQTKEQYEEAWKYPEISSIYVDYDSFSMEEIIDMAKASCKANKTFYVLLPHICRMKVYDQLDKDIDNLMGYKEVDGFIAKNFEEVELLQRLFSDRGEEKRLRLNHNMYIFNKEAKLFWKDKNVHAFTAPVELNEKELMDLGLEELELMVYGYLPLMVTAQCLYTSTNACNKCKAASNKIDYILDRMGKRFYVKASCSSCSNIIYNGQRLSLLGQADQIRDLGPDGIRLDFTFETVDEVKAVLSAYRDVFYYGKNPKLDFDNVTTGHFKRGVL